MESYHQEEEHCRRIIKKKYPNYPIAKKYFSSTYKAVEAYWAFFRYIEAWERRIRVWKKRAI